METELSTTIPQTPEILPASDDYSNILQAYGLTYTSSEYYLQAGTLTQVQGWILHIAVIKTQIPALLAKLVPELIQQQVPFKIPVNEVACDGLLGGMYGYTLLGKAVCIYPENEMQALALAQRLLAITAEFKGPDIPTAIHLGTVVHARYGGWTPVLQPGPDGNSCEYIYDQQGQLIPDSYSVPFTLPVGISWPFDPIKPYSVRIEKPLLNDYIKPVAVLKHDVKGRVIKGMYLKKWFWAKPCLVKEGKKHMFSDGFGRDIQDRLEWQIKVHNDLGNSVPIPKILDHFKENGDLYVMMEFIEGESLDQKIMNIYAGNSWINLARQQRVLLLDYLLQVLDVVGRLHERGYVHRDLTPANFIFNNKQKLHIIDLELTYSINEQIPNPPYIFTTLGFMPPEQNTRPVPTVKEDIYGLGALMIVFFTCLSPLKFEAADTELLKEHLYFFIKDREMANLIADCLQTDARQRPTFAVIRETVQRYRNKQDRLPTQLPAEDILIPAATMADVIQQGLRGIICERMATEEGLWVSKTIQVNQQTGNPLTAYSIYPGFYEGVTGPLYLISQLARAGIPIDDTIRQYYAYNINFLKTGYLQDVQTMPAGLYLGSAGVALMLAASIDAVLLENTASNISLIRQCLERAPEELNLVSGAAGQGLALLHCLHLLPEPFGMEQLQQHCMLLLQQQQKNGAWVVPLNDGKGGYATITGLAQGIAGITYFLLMAAARLKDENITHAAVKALAWLQQQAHVHKQTYSWPVNSINKQAHLWEHIGIAGITLTFIKAYELIKDPVYKTIATGALANYSPFVLDRNLSHAWGITGLGELYLEAGRVFKEDEWNKKAVRIAGALTHLRKQQDTTSCYWITDAIDIIPTADLMTGCSGVIYFLARILHPEKLTYPLQA
ncbi:lanthionine synthetase LanC family protein [Chitinophaga sp. GbtcB8]|uniref:class III lanthionine synthetase LanKC N-terminal domain-containing protein n=1 Tax=Chitinophaga sp. GbtcB8 TaxID=2824753 RepID=UPI001C30D395|nr:lanthionine synthetase LanC family protein [Chitinophaga sp. GbtcB8]